ncbi:hypothetical protein ACWGSK_26935 [Nocardiopsis sp. NPDC055551]
MLATLVRLLRPAHGLHAAPRALRRDLREEARAARVRRYADPLPARPTGPGYASALRPVPADYVSVVQAEAVSPPADIVRGYYRAHEARQRNARMDRDRLGVAVLLDVATATRVAVTA